MAAGYSELPNTLVSAAALARLSSKSRHNPDRAGAPNT